MTLSAGSVPDLARPHLGLFSSEAFYALRSMAWQPLELFAGGSPVGTLVTTGGRAVYTSGSYAPWGGADWINDRVPPETVDEALAAVPFVTATRIVIRCAPSHHGPAQAATLVTLTRLGFRPIAADLSYWIDLPATVNEYERGLKHEARLALAKTQDDFRGAWLDQDNDEGWTAAYDLLDANRRAKGRRMSFELEYLLRIRDAFPGLVRMLVVGDVQVWRAAALVYRVARGRDYVQAWGHDLAAEGRSPMNVVAREVVKASIESGAVSLNLGKSSNDGVPDAGLCRFKRSIGAQPEVLWTLAR